MHDVVILSDERLVAALMAAQGPDWAGLPVKPVTSGGTDNAMFRLGPRWAMRMPRRPEAVQLIEKEARWLPTLSGLPLKVPAVRLLGQPTAQFNWPFTVVDWIDGIEAQASVIHDWQSEVATLARFLRALWKKPVKGAPEAGPHNHMRGANLRDLTQAVLRAVADLDDEIDAAATREVWLNALEAAPARKKRWVHGDLKAANMLARDGGLVAVIDWGLAAVGDPAVDVAVAWRWVPEWQMTPFQEALGIDDDGWRRARGWALYVAVIALANYRDRPGYCGLVEECRCTLGRLGLSAAC